MRAEERRRGSLSSSPSGRGAEGGAWAAIARAGDNEELGHWCHVSDVTFAENPLAFFLFCFSLKPVAFRDLIEALKHFRKFENIWVGSPCQVEPPQKLVFQNKMF